MQCWLPAQGGGMAVLRVLSIVAATTFLSQHALGFDETLEPVSTLGMRVPDSINDDFELQKIVIDLARRGDRTEQRSAIRFIAPGRASTTKQRVRKKQVSSSTVKSSVKENSKRGSRPSVSSKTITSKNSAQSTSASKVSKKQTITPAANPTSPFQKWSKSRQAEGMIAEGSVAKTEETPQVARLLRRSARPIPRQSSTGSSRNQSSRTKKTSARSVLDITPTEEIPPPLLDDRDLDVPADDLPPLTTSQLNLRRKVRDVLTHYYRRPLNTRDRSPWELMHAMLAFEANSKVLQGGPNGKSVSAVGWLCFNQACKRYTLMYMNSDNRLAVRVGPALQGHRGQMLSMLAQSRISEEYPMLVDGQKLKIADLIDMEMRTCYPRTELTFKLIGLMHYLDSDATWVNDQGMEWDIPRLIAEEIRQPVRGAACGGTHRLSGLTLAYKTREKRGEPVDGQYLRAKNFVNRYQQYAYRLQNRDGSFSTEWFRGRGNDQDIDRNLKTTGHILEWLLYAANQQQLHHWRTTKAVNYLTNLMYRHRNRDWESGPLGHAIHALVVYDRLVFLPYDTPQTQPVAKKKPAASKRR